MHSPVSQTPARAAASSRGALLLTGATGFVGGELLARFAERSDRTIYVLVRAADPRSAAERIGDSRVIALPGDVTRPALGLDSLDSVAEEVTDIVHAAASVSFGLDLDRARAINVEGTRRMLEFAGLCARRGAGLRSLAHVSTAYVAGRHAGTFAERQLDVGQRFRNPYEQSKFEAERLVRAHMPDLPISVFRPSIVVGDRRTGWTQSFNVLYGPLRMFARGSYPALPARRAALVDVVSVDYVADAVIALHERGDGRTYHLCAGDDAPTVGELVDLAAEHYGRPAPVSLPPLLYRRVVHPVALRAAPARQRRMLRHSEVYFPYFDVATVFDDEHTRTELLPLGVRRVPVTAYFDRLVDFAERADWGRRQIPRKEVLR